MTECVSFPRGDAFGIHFWPVTSSLDPGVPLSMSTEAGKQTTLRAPGPHVRKKHLLGVTERMIWGQRSLLAAPQMILQRRPEAPPTPQPFTAGNPLLHMVLNQAPHYPPLSSSHSYFYSKGSSQNLPTLGSLLRTPHPSVTAGCCSRSPGF